MNRTIALIAINSIILVLFLASYFLNRLSNNGICFGVRFPMEYLKSKELKNMDKSYKNIILIMFLLIFIVVNMIVFEISNFNDDIIGIVIGITTIVSLIASNIIFILYYFKTKKLKRVNGWTYKNKNVVVTDTTLRKPKKSERFKPINSKWFLILFIFPLAMLLLTIFKYDGLKDTMEIYNTSFGIFKTNSLKGKLIIYQFPLAQFFMCIIMYLMNLVINNSRYDLNSGYIEYAVIRKKKFKWLGSIMMMVISLQIMIMFSIIQCSILLGFDITRVSHIFMVALFLTIIIFIIAFIKVGQDKRMLDDFKEKDELYKDDDDKWILGGLYFNKNDSAWLIEKRTGIGWTLNFANPKSWIAIGALIIFILVNIFISIYLT